MASYKISRFLKPPLPKKYIPFAILILGFLGFIDLTYLTIQHYKNLIPPCTILHGCDRVLTSQFATVFGIPVSLIGAGFFLLVIILAGLSFNATNRLIANILFVVCFLGFLVALILFGIQAFVLQAFCQYCL